VTSLRLDISKIGEQCQRRKCKRSTDHEVRWQHWHRGTLKVALRHVCDKHMRKHYVQLLASAV
jgi:hypothetical protein